MGRQEIETALKISAQYLNPVYNPDQPGGIPAQEDQAKKTIQQVMDVLIQKEPKVKNLWNIIKKV
jgi:hypothetical protein